MIGPAEVIILVIAITAIICWAIYMLAEVWFPPKRKRRADGSASSGDAGYVPVMYGGDGGSSDGGSSDGGGGGGGLMAGLSHNIAILLAMYPGDNKEFALFYKGSDGPDAWAAHIDNQCEHVGLGEVSGEHVGEGYTPEAAVINLIEAVKEKYR